MADIAVAGNFVLVRVEAANDADVFKAAEQMGLWTPRDVKVYDKRDNTGVFIYGRLYLKTTVAVGPVAAPPVQPPKPVAPRVVGRPAYGSRLAPTNTDYDDSDDREREANGLGRNRPAPF